MEKRVDIIGGGLAGSEAALQLAADGFAVRLIEMRPFRTTGAHHGDKCAELVCSNSLKSTKEASAAGMLKAELKLLGSRLLAFAHESSVPAGGALAVDREQFASLVTDALVQAGVARIEAEVVGIDPSGALIIEDAHHEGPNIFLRTRHRSASSLRALLTSPALAESLRTLTGEDHLSFYDAAAPIVYADSLDHDVVFGQSRYEEGGRRLSQCPLRQRGIRTPSCTGARRCSCSRYQARVRDEPTLFQACQPIRRDCAPTGSMHPGFGPLKPVGLADPITGSPPLGGGAIACRG